MPPHTPRHRPWPLAWWLSPPPTLREAGEHRGRTVLLVHVGQIRASTGRPAVVTTLGVHVSRQVATLQQGEDTGPRLGTPVVVTPGVLLASRGWGPGMLLIAPQCPDGPPQSAAAPKSPASPVPRADHNHGSGGLDLGVQ